MPEPPRGTGSFLSELKRRRVFRVAAVYAAVVFVVVQVADIAFPALHLPEWTLTFVIVLALLGFPLALVLAWALEVTPEGVRRTDPLPREAELPNRAASSFGSPRAAGYVGLGIVVGLVAVGAYAAMRTSTPPAGAKIESIAVLPFDNIGADPENEYFADGITEDIITNLSTIPALKVISRTSVMNYRDTNKPLRQIGEELGVVAVVEGSIRRSGEEVFVVARLVDARSDEQIWAESYERQLSGIFGIQSDIARNIVEQLRTTISPQGRRRLAAQPTEDVEAYKLYLKGRHAWNKRTDGALREAIGYFQQAIERDPTFALAYAGLADVYDVLPYYDYGLKSARETFAKARAAANQALAIDPSLGEAHTALAWALWHQSRTEEAGREFRRALELNPSYATGHQWYALYLAGVGQQEAAIEAMLRAHELDPLSLIITTEVGLIYLYARDFERALDWANRAIEMDPAFDFAWQTRFRAQVLDERFDDAIATLRTAPSMGPDDFLPSMVDSLERAYEARGRRGYYESMIEVARDAPPTMRAGYHAALGQREEALRLVEQAVEEGDPFVTQALFEPELEPLRGDPRFERLLRAAERP